MAWWLECSPKTRETWVQYQVESYQRLLKWYLIPPCLTLSIIRYGSRVKWSNPGKGVGPSPTPWWTSYRKGNLRVTLDYSPQLTLSHLIYIYIYIYIWLNIINIFCLHMFLLIFSNCRIDLIIFGENWLINLP